MKKKPTQKVLSLRDAVKGAVVELLDDEGMACLQTQDGLVTLINALAHYTEEGHSLFPQIFVFDSLGSILSMAPGSQHVQIGQGEKTPATMARALKKCAPLARAGWAVYIERQQNSFSYGVIRSGSNILSVSLTETLVNKGNPEIAALILHQVGSNIIELRGVSQSALLVHFGAAREAEASPVPAMTALAHCIASGMPQAIQEQGVTVYQRIITDVLRAGHGTLAAVIQAKKKSLPRQFSDAIRLSPFVSIADKISAVLEKGDSQSNTQLAAFGSLIAGMMLSDGITVFGTDGSVRAYNVFVKHPREKSAELTAGGARHRTFDVLTKMVGKELAGAYMQSQDGRVAFEGGTSK